MEYSEIEREIDCASRELIDLLKAKKMTIGTAESCTAGMIAARLGDYAGVSDVFLGGVVSYANEVKTNVLGVPETVIATVGAVSEECAGHMAEGARRVLRADVAVSATGIAGPGGGTAEKPVGTVCFGAATPGGVRTMTVHFPSSDDRGMIRRKSVLCAMKLCSDAISS